MTLKTCGKEEGKVLVGEKGREGKRWSRRMKKKAQERKGGGADRLGDVKVYEHISI